MFFVRTGRGQAAQLCPELSRREDVLCHAADSWVPLPPTRLRSGPVRWEVSPDDVGWRLPTSDQAQHALVAAMVALDASLLDARHSRTITPAPPAPAATVYPMTLRRSARSTADSPVEVLRRAA